MSGAFRPFMVALLIAIAGCGAVMEANKPPSFGGAVTPPSSDISSEVAAFSGVFIGKWGRLGQLDGGLAVERIEGRTAHIFYSWGVYFPWYIYAPGYSRVVGDVDTRGVLRFGIPGRGIKVALRPIHGGRMLFGEYEINRQLGIDGGLTYGFFVRADLPLNYSGEFSGVLEGQLSGRFIQAKIEQADDSPWLRLRYSWGPSSRSGGGQDSGSIEVLAVVTSDNEVLTVVPTDDGLGIEVSFRLLPNGTFSGKWRHPLRGAGAGIFTHDGGGGLALPRERK